MVDHSRIILDPSVQQALIIVVKIVGDGVVYRLS